MFQLKGKKKLSIDHNSLLCAHPRWQLKTTWIGCTQTHDNFKRLSRWCPSEVLWSWQVVGECEILTVPWMFYGDRSTYFSNVFTYGHTSCGHKNVSNVANNLLLSLKFHCITSVQKKLPDVVLKRNANMLSWKATKEKDWSIKFVKKINSAAQ